MKSKYLLLTMLLGVASMGFAQEYDDIYYSESKSQIKTQKSKRSDKQTGSNYIKDMSSVDIDAYNRRGESYYGSPVDTIGAKAAESQDYVYTQQIQQYYNPTIVVDNQELLDEVINGSSGNVTVIYTGTTPYLIPSYCPVPTSVLLGNSPWRWYWGSNWIDWAIWADPWFNPWYVLNYGYYNWGWNTGWGWSPYYYPYRYPAGWGYGWAWRNPRNYYAHHYRPNMHGNGYVRPGWASNTRPSNMATATHRPNIHRPGGTGGVRPGYTATVRPGYSGSATARPSTGTSTMRPGSTSTRPGYTPTVRPGYSGSATARPSTGTSTTRPGSSSVRPGYTPSVRPGYSGTATARPSTGTSTTRPGSSSVRPSYTPTVRPGHSGTVTSRPSTTTSTTRPSSTTTSRPSYTPSVRPGNSGSSSSHRSTSGYSTGRSSGGSYSAPSRSTGGGSRGGGGGRHR